MKSYTDIEQSKKLAEILPHESADMIYYWFGNFELNDEWYELYLGTNRVNDKDILAWSLAALLDVLPKIINNETLFIETSAALWHIGYRNIYTARTDNPIDACVEMILKLHEQNLL